MTKFLKLYSNRNSLGKALLLTFLIWLIYRLFFRFPEWFDEAVVKAVVFGVPAWIYAKELKNSSSKLGLTQKSFWRGMFAGLLLGGFYQFVVILGLRLRGDSGMQQLLLSSPVFWKVFFIAVLTAWWESLFFFGYVLNRLLERTKNVEMLAVGLAIIVFLVFHAPLRIMLVGSSQELVGQLIILGIFAAGQAILFLRTRSLYAVTISHALWGLVFMIYG